MRVLRSVQGKVVSIIIAVLAVAVAGAIYLTVANQRDSFLNETSRNLTVTSTIVNDVVRNAMLLGEAPIAVRTMADLQGIGGFEELAIYRRDGTTAFHDDETIRSVNQRLGKEAFQVTDRVELRTVNNESFARVLRTSTPSLVESAEDQNVEYYFPILNYSDCRECHGTDHFIRGVAYFRVSTEPIYAQLADTRNTLTFFFIVAGVILAAMIIFMLRRIVLRPVLLIGSTVNQVGQGNLDAQLSLRTSDELGELATEINGMIAGLKEKSRLEVENRVIEAKNEENRKYLDNINEGLLLLDADLRISEQYSSFLEELFGTTSISGRRFSEFIYPEDPPDSQRRVELDEFVGFVFSNTATDMEMIDSINPLSNKRLAVSGAGGTSQIVVDASFQRIMKEGVVQNVMVIFVDKTQLVQAEEALQVERLRSETEIEQIAAILRSGPRSFEEFTDEAERTLRMLDENVDLTGGEEELAALFRDLHSLKGSARYVELKSFAQSLDDAETIVAEVRDGRRKSGPDTAREMKKKLDELHAGVQNIRTINERFREFATLEGEHPATASSVRTFLDNLERMATSDAAELDKKVAVRTSTDVQTLSILPQVRNPVIHLVRNSIAHGIEDGLERISAGKPEEGVIEVRFSRESDRRCRIDVRDDGRGIDFESVRTRAVALGLADEDASTNELLRVLFSPAFSSADKADGVSGRGVGLDAVQAAVASLGGTISVGTRPGVGTRFTLRLPAESRGGTL